MSLVRGDEALEHLKSGGTLECVKCHAEYDHDSIDDLVADPGDDPACLDDCKCQGFIPRRPPSSVDARFPDTIGSWMPLPRALLEHGGELGLSASDRMILIALESHRRNRGQLVYPSHKRLGLLTGLSVSQLKVRLERLEDAGLIVICHKFNENGAQRSNRYDLEPLWQKVAALRVEANEQKKKQPRPETGYPPRRSPAGAGPESGDEEEAPEGEEERRGEPEALRTPQGSPSPVGGFADPGPSEDLEDFPF